MAELWDLVLITNTEYWNRSASHCVFCVFSILQQRARTAEGEAVGVWHGWSFERPCGKRAVSQISGVRIQFRKLKVNESDFVFYYLVRDIGGGFFVWCFSFFWTCKKISCLTSQNPFMHIASCSHIQAEGKIDTVSRDSNEAYCPIHVQHLVKLPM